MTSNASGIRDTARVLGITTDKVTDTLKKQNAISQIHYNYIDSLVVSKSVVEIIAWNKVDSCELDKILSFFHNKSNKLNIFASVKNALRVPVSSGIYCYGLQLTMKPVQFLHSHLVGTRMKFSNNFN